MPEINGYASLSFSPLLSAYSGTTGSQGGRSELLVRKEQEQDELMERLTLQNRKKQAAEAAARLKEFKTSLKKQAPSETPSPQN